MAIQFTDMNDFEDQLCTLLSKIEGLTKQPTDVGDHTVTYGYGYTFIRKDINGKWEVYKNLTSDLAAIGITLTDDQKAKLGAIFKSLNEGKGSTATHAQLISDFAASFSNNNLSPDDAKTLLAVEWLYQKELIQAQFETLLGKTDGDAVFQRLECTREMLAVASLFYNSPSLLGPGMARALRDGSRAEAWFEIRYGWANNNPIFNDGWAKRHYYESEIFGLYNDPNNVTLGEAKDIFRMRQLHRPKITDYEGKYSTQVANANSDYNLTGSEMVDTLELALDPAKTTLINNLNANFNANITADDYKSTDIYIDPGRSDSKQTFDLNHSATLTGSERNDIILGEAGDDTLIGGTGDDVLVGGKGFDTYIWSSGDGNDRIIEEREDNGKVSGIIKINNGQYDLTAAGFFELVDGQPNVWEKEMDDGSIIKITHNASWKMVMEDGSELLLGEDFESGDFGIGLEPEITLNGTPDRDEMGVYDSPQRLEMTSFPPGTTMNTPFYDQPLPTTAPRMNITGGDAGDFLFGFVSHDKIDGGAGNDIIIGHMGSSNGVSLNTSGPLEGDLLSGGAGNDYIQGTGADDNISGGADNDILPGFDGEDVMEGEAGNDIILGASHDDILVGGDGDERLSQFQYRLSFAR